MFNQLCGLFSSIAFVSVLIIAMFFFLNQELYKYCSIATSDQLIQLHEAMCTSTKKTDEIVKKKNNEEAKIF